MPLVFDVDAGEDVVVLVTVADYQRLSGDSTSTEDDAEQALLDAQKLIEEWLRRELSEGERTETLKLYSGKVYPSVTPLIYTADGTISKTAIITADPDAPVFITSWTEDDEPNATVTYTGGFTEENLPRTLQLAIVRVARSLLNDATTITDVPAGVSSIAVGDVRVSYRDNASVGLAGGLTPEIKDSIKRYRRVNV